MGNNSRIGITPRWKYVRSGTTYYVYSRARPKIEGIERAGAYDRARNALVDDDLCDFADPNQFQNWSGRHG